MLTPDISAAPTSERAPAPTFSPPWTVAAALPALNGRSVRNLRHVRTIRLVRRWAAGAVAAFAFALGAGYGLPAYGQAVTPPPPPPLPVPQMFSVPAVVMTPVVTRDDYTVTEAPLQWPVPLGTPISDGFGYRISPCAGCSSNHEGVDFDPGFGAQIHAIADGVVVETNSPGYSALGVHVAIQHLIDGQTVTSAYGHMQLGSMTLAVGDIVRKGQVVGLVGSTGASTGAHLHFEIRVGGTRPVDPMAWMHARLG